MAQAWMHRLCAALALLCVFSTAPAVAEVAVPPLTARVIDQTGTLSKAQQAELERTLADFEARKGSQIAVLMVPTTEPETIEQYSIRVAEQWKLGRKGVDDGALLLIAKDDRTLRIEVGYGLEGPLSDLVSKRIISEDIVPHLRQGDFAAGIRTGVERMIRVVDGEPLPPPPPQQEYSNGGPSLDNALPLILVFAVIGGGILRAILGPLLGALATGSVVAIGAWLLLGVLSFALIAGLIAAVATLAGVGRGGHFGGGGGFGGRGGFGGGGFSGGGGGFGGGGASGRF